MLRDKKVLITGVTGQVARPIAEAYATDNEVWGLARFQEASNLDPWSVTGGAYRLAGEGGAAKARAELEAVGIRTVSHSLGSDALDDVPTDFTHVIHAAATKITPDHDGAISTNAEGTGLLLQHCRKALAILYVSSFAVYRPLEPAHPHAETDPLGGEPNYYQSYPAGKIATEGVVRAAGRMLEVPTVVARLNLCYGPAGHGGMPVRLVGQMMEGSPILVPRGRDSFSSPIHTDDIIRQTEALLGVASIPCTVVNWAGDDVVSQRDFAEFVGNLRGMKPSYEEADAAVYTYASDNERRQQLIGRCSVWWKDGMRQTIDTFFPAAPDGRN